LTSYVSQNIVSNAIILTPTESEEPGHQVLDSDLLLEMSPEPPQATGPVVPVPRGKLLAVPHNTTDGHSE
jgi:hypothetical protein